MAPTISRDTLPSIVTDGICRYLQKNYRESLCSLSLVNKRCYDISTPYIYRSICFNISSRARLRREIEEFNNNCLRQRCLEYTRCIKLVGRMPTAPEDEGQWFDVQEEDRLYDFEYDDFIMNNLDARTWLVSKEDLGGNVWSAAWEPLISLIPRFRYLTDFIYSCTSEYPPYLAQTLHQHHPYCRLDMRKVKFSSLIDSTRDPDEMELASSPCLHALAIAISDVQPPRGDLGSDDVLRIMSGLAPNLKKVRVHQLVAGERPFGHVRKVFVPIAHGPKLGAITSLSLLNFTFDTEHMELFALHTDLGKLQALAFRPSYNALLKAARERPFPSLERLGISGAITLDPDPRIGSGASAFLESLNTLSTLMITDDIVD
ncbi:hypothetical protein FQN51_001857 [Onygenales sp. PD_10]|nr:hypothetical protein FQN51_001857 [Onygenales sp. PD_10]